MSNVIGLLAAIREDWRRRIRRRSEPYGNRLEGSERRSLIERRSVENAARWRSSHPLSGRLYVVLIHTAGSEGGYVAGVLGVYADSNEAWHAGRDWRQNKNPDTAWWSIVGTSLIEAVADAGGTSYIDDDTLNA